ncbi:hypothetical protein [Oceanobacillus alkalisoli]|uniref:hypothetical protein n=1 Tax=Oceanobacillus alkalisoli TaxID=2925113 RepID=UPI001EF1013A|nr:hypothetical protein [Oceanobacillus alkalisoli]MCF3942747.1 hypothetical protein [Oceanobacillus alkalisoli]MCG5102718.1 hypothetical protein [Oceanobacillus alkalisoli]
MKVMPVKHATYEQLDEFLSRNERLDKPLLFDKGFVVEIGGQIEASFILDELDSGGCWLKQLYITQSHAAKLPILLETILQIARKQEAGTVYVHSHQPVVDILLESLDFQPEKNKQIIPERPIKSGCWWSYQVS